MATNPVLGSASVGERTSPQALAFKMLAKRVANTLRCGLPGIITKFNPTTQYAQVKLAITENVIYRTTGVKPTEIKPLDDVLVLFPGDASWCLTFPSLVGTEVYVCFADMCINAWSTYGFKKDSNTGRLTAQNQEVQRRHDLSDGFAILAPRSQPNRIPSFSTTAVELRSISGPNKFALNSNGSVLMQGTQLQFNESSSGVIPGNSTNDKFCLPILINGVQWYMRLSQLP